jgi:hypothetical protein
MRHVDGESLDARVRPPPVRCRRATSFALRIDENNHMSTKYRLAKTRESAVDC